MMLCSLARRAPLRGSWLCRTRALSHKGGHKGVHHRSKYQYWVPIQSRWKDNDMYGHVNNTEYYSYFDTVINHFLIKKAGLSPLKSDTIGLCVESQCNFFSPLEFPSVIEAGLYISHKGKSSIRYEVGIFEEGAEEAAAHGHFVHVFVDEVTRKPMPFPREIGEAVDGIFVRA